MAWLSDTESALETLELELDSYGPGVKTSRERVLMQLKVRHTAILDYTLLYIPCIYTQYIYCNLILLSNSSGAAVALHV